MTPGLDDLPTLGELNRNIGSLRDELRETRTQLGQLGAIQTRLEVLGRDLDSQRSRLDELDENIRWAMRLVVGAVILALLGLVIGTARSNAPAQIVTPTAPSAPAEPSAPIPPQL